MSEYQPKTGAKCGCRRGVQRDNCQNCEGTGMVIDFKAILARGGEDMNIQPKIARTTHTPGPWFTTSEMQGVNGVKVYGVETRDRYPIANCGTGKLGMENAHLIAAAPAMYEALRAIIKNWERGDLAAAVRQGAAALAQAEGRQ